MDKDENTLDYILCTHLFCVLILGDSEKKYTLLNFYYWIQEFEKNNKQIILFLGQGNSEWTKSDINYNFR